MQFLSSLDFYIEMSSSSPEGLKLAWLWVIEALADSKKLKNKFLKELIERNLEGLEDSNVKENVSLRYLEELVDSDGLKSSGEVDSSLFARVLADGIRKIKVDPRSEDVLCRSIRQLKDSIDKACVKSVSSLMGKHGLSQEIQPNHLHNLTDNRLNHRGDVPSPNISPWTDVHSADLHGLNECKKDPVCIVNDSTLSHGKQSLGELQNGDKKHTQFTLNWTSLMRKDGLPEKNQTCHLHNLDDDDRLKKISSCSDKVPSSSILPCDVPSPNISPRSAVHSVDLHDLNQCKKDSVFIANDSTLSNRSNGKQSLGELQNGDKKFTQRPMSRTSFMRKHGLLKEFQLHNLGDDNRLKKISSCSDKVPSSSILHCDDVPSPSIPSRSGVHSIDLRNLNQCKKGSVFIANDSTLSSRSSGKQSPGEMQTGDKKDTHPLVIQTEESRKHQDTHDNEKTVHNSLKEAIEAYVKAKLVTSQIPDDDETQQQMCIKCNKSDHLLRCCGDCCPIAIHEGCLGCPVSFDEDTGEFHCPLCSYIKAAKACSDAKKKVYRCKKSLSSFMMGLDQVSSMKPVQSVSQKRSSCSNEDVKEHYHIQERVKRNKENAMKETGLNMTGEHPMNSSKTLNQKKRRGPVIIVKDNNALTCNEIAKSGEEDSHDIQVTEESQRNKRDEAIKGSNASEQYLFEKDSERMNESKDQMPSSSAVEREVQIPTQENNSEKYRNPRNRKPLKRYANSLYPYHRRNRLAWTEEEEEILKTAVEKLSNDKVNYPWKEILDYGQNIFHKTRQPQDLKDKWRNMRKKM